MKRWLLTSLVLAFAGLGYKCAGGSKRAASLTNNNASTSVEAQSSSDLKRKADLQNRYQDMLDEIKRESLKSKMNNLREEGLSDSEAEIRIWIGFGLAYPRCFILRYSNGNPTAFYLAPKPNGTKAATDSSGEVLIAKTVLNAPASGWEEFNRFLKEEGIDYPLRLSLDESQISDPDAESMVVEVRSGTRYSMVFFSLHADSQDGRKALEVCRRIEREFKVRMGCGDIPSSS